MVVYNSARIPCSQKSPQNYVWTKIYKYERTPSVGSFLFLCLEWEMTGSHTKSIRLNKEKEQGWKITPEKKKRRRQFFVNIAISQNNFLALCNTPRPPLASKISSTYIIENTNLVLPTFRYTQQSVVFLNSKEVTISFNLKIQLLRGLFM